MRRGHAMSVMRVYRLYRDDKLAVRRLRRKRLTRVPVASHLVKSNQEWVLDFACDTLATGRGIRVLALVNAFTSGREFVEPSSNASPGSDSMRQQSGVALPFDGVGHSDRAMRHHARRRALFGRSKQRRFRTHVNHNDFAFDVAPPRDRHRFHGLRKQPVR